MNLLNYDELPYPIFETTDAEKEVLKNCLSSIKLRGQIFVCHLLLKEGAVGDALRNKIIISLSGCVSLAGYVEDALRLKAGSYLRLHTYGNYCGYQLREVWIRKLLEY